MKKWGKMIAIVLVINFLAIVGSELLGISYQEAKAEALLYMCLIFILDIYQKIDIY